MTPAQLWQATEVGRKEVWGGEVLPWSQLDSLTRKVYTIAANILNGKSQPKRAAKA
jgi:hypothetical protein